MKTTFLVRDGLCQVVLHPETRHERAVLDTLQGDHEVVVRRAQFAESQAGYVRDYSRFSTSPLDAAHLPDTVLVMTPQETPGPVRPDQSLVALDVDLGKRTDGTWVYRDEDGKWRPCPSPGVAPNFPPDDVHSYFRRTADDVWQVYDRKSQVWHPTTGVPEVAKWTYEEQQLRTELRSVLELVESPGTSVEGLVARVRKVAEICKNALGEGK